MSYAACPCRWCVPSAGKAKRNWKRMLHKSARARDKRVIAEEARLRRQGDD
jgi:hypothetical protein